MLGVRTYEQAYVNACRRHVEAAVAAHRLRAVEGKDGNPLNAVRLIAASLLTNNGRLLSDKQIKLDPAQSVPGLPPNEEIHLDHSHFQELAAAYFTDIEKRFT